jgi:hypothetical protein
MLLAVPFAAHVRHFSLPCHTVGTQYYPFIIQLPVNTAFIQFQNVQTALFSFWCLACITCGNHFYGKKASSVDINTYLINSIK